MNILTPNEHALVLLLAWLDNEAYHFITPTPLTHQRIISRRTHQEAENLRDVFGWSLPFASALLPPDIVDLLKTAGVLLHTNNGKYRSTIRVSTIEKRLFIHSAFPTEGEDAIFFGPDTYRFVNFLRQNLLTDEAREGFRLLDVGCGSGAGALMAAQYCPKAQLTLSDINPIALRYSAINAQYAGLAVNVVLSDVLAETPPYFDVIISNPPFLHDDYARLYRHGGEGLGRALSVRIVEESLDHLAADGRLFVYTGVAIIDGCDYFLAEMTNLLADSDFDWQYQELDPDIFGEELDRPIYHQVERIAAVGLSVRKRRSYF